VGCAARAAAGGSLPNSVQVRIVHDPTDEVVPVEDAHLIAAEMDTEVHEAAGGHHRIIGSDEMRSALSACLRLIPIAPAYA
jgi:hypothetical protein